MFRLIFSVIFCYLFLFSTLAKAESCDKCVTIDGARVQVLKMGIMPGSYYYFYTKDERKVKFPEEALRKVQIAFVLGLDLYVNTNTNNFSLMSD